MPYKNTVSFIEESVARLNNAENKQKQQAHNEKVQSFIIKEKLYALQKRIDFQDEKINTVQIDLAVVNNLCNKSINKVAFISNKHTSFVSDIDATFDQHITQLDYLVTYIKKQNIMINQLVENNKIFKNSMLMMADEIETLKKKINA